MSNHYRPPRSGKRSLATALLAAVVLVGGVFVYLRNPTIPFPTAVTPPDTTQRHTTHSAPDYAIPSPMPKLPEAAPKKTKAAVPMRSVGSGIYRCEDANRAVTYSQFPCDDFKTVDTKPTSAGFGESWQTTVKHR